MHNLTKYIKVVSWDYFSVLDFLLVNFLLTNSKSIMHFDCLQLSVLCRIFLCIRVILISLPLSATSYFHFLNAGVLFQTLNFSSRVMFLKRLHWFLSLSNKKSSPLQGFCSFSIWNNYYCLYSQSQHIVFPLQSTYLSDI